MDIESLGAGAQSGEWLLFEQSLYLFSSRFFKCQKVKHVRSSYETENRREFSPARTGPIANEIRVGMETRGE